MGLDPEILGEGLELALEWGPPWLQSIQGRLRALHPELSDEVLDDANGSAAKR